MSSEIDAIFPSFHRRLLGRVRISKRCGRQWMYVRRVAIQNLVRPEFMEVHHGYAQCHRNAKTQ